MKTWKLIQDKIDPELDQRLSTEEKQSQEEALQERFVGRFASTRSWLHRNAQNRQTAHALSYIANIVSAAAGFYGCKVLLESLALPYLYWLPYALAIVILIAMEKYKRKYSDIFWDYFWAKNKSINWTAGSVNFSLFALSIVLSVAGMYFFNMDHAGEAGLVGQSTDPEALALQDELSQAKDEYRAMVEDQSNYNHEGKFYYKLIPSKNALQERINNLTSTLRDKHGVYNVQNQDILREFNLRRHFKAYTGIIITLLAELVFEICMCFGSYYDLRFFRAMKRGGSGGSGRPGGYQLNGSHPTGEQKKSPALA